MRATLALLALVGSAAAQAVTSEIAPQSTPPPGCQNSRHGSFELQIVSANGSSSSGSSRRDLETRQNPNGNLELSLAGGLLTDSNGRTGYIASNYQFQFDSPPQAGAIYTAGWTICPNGSIALGGQALFWQCQSGSFYNLYDRDFAPEHCYPVYFQSGTGQGDAYSAAPSGPIATGSSEASITNGGGTMSGGAATTTAAMSSYATAPANGTMPATGGATGAPPAPTAAPTVATGGAPVDSPKALFAWAMGAVGALAML